MAVRAVAAALFALVLVAAPATRSQAATCGIEIEVFRAGFIIGVSGGRGTLRCGNQRIPLSIGGVSVGATIGASNAVLVGRALNVRNPADVGGAYSAAGAGVAVLRGPTAVRLVNARGVVLELRGRQVGLEFSLDLSGMVITLR